MVYCSRGLSRTARYERRTLRCSTKPSFLAAETGRMRQQVSIQDGELSVLIWHTIGQKIVDSAHESVLEGDVVWILGTLKPREVSVVGIEILHSLISVSWPYDDDIV